MRSLDHDYLPKLFARIRSIPGDATPAWGRMTPSEMVAHLVATVRYSMGRSGTLPIRGTWLTRRVYGPLLLRGVVKLPKNIRAPRLGPKGARPHVQDDFETLQALLEEYLQLVQADELACAPHPYLGHIGVDGWARFHVIHFEHHLRQFRV